MPARAVVIANHHPRLRLDRRALVHAVHVLDAHAAKFLGGPPPGELSLVFLTDPALAKLHADFLDDPTITDVITFEGDSTAGLAGEVCVSADAALRQTSALSSPVRQAQGPRALSRGQPSALSFSTELLLYVVHGWLHLAGYDDLVPAKKRAMRRAEARAMELLRRTPGLTSAFFRLVAR
jgi:probable rRNA maturation factor